MHDHVPSSDAPPAPPAPVETLRSFVSASFSADEFRRWIRELSPQNPNFAHGLPSPPVDDLKLFDDGVGLLERNKFIDSELLDSLARRFPRKLAELAAVADHTGIRWQPPEPSPKPWPPHHVGGSRSRTIQHLALVLLAIGATSVLAWTLLYLNREPTSPGIVAPTPTPAVMPDPVSDTSTSKVLMQHPSGEPQTATSIDHADESPPGRKTNEPTKSSTIIPDVATTKAVEQAPPPCKDVSPLLRQVLDKIASDCIADLTRQFSFTISLSHKSATATRISEEPPSYEKDKHCVYEALRAKVQSAEFVGCPDHILNVTFHGQSAISAFKAR